MPVLASTVFATARTLLNDDGNSYFTDTVLLPKLVEAFRELQAKLKLSAAPVMRTESIQNIAIGITTLILPPDLEAPIRLWEKAVPDPITNFIPMTEQDPLPNIAQGLNLVYWQWYQQAINLIGSTATRSVKIQYWRALAEPTGPGDDLIFNRGELFLAPRTAGLAAGSVGEDDAMQKWSDIGMASLNDVIMANRGRVSPSDRP